ncbi:MAG TPA: SDR family oxidoreductase [Polyangiaceae bacterium]|jgi:UDP-glucose 4-epimerase|nr:SDR family oxidoreductase [Polyangiaceae bacterium]
MSAPLVWVVGAGGMLGSAVCRELGSDAWRPERGFTWQDSARVGQELKEAVGAFAASVSARAGSAWAVAWCAGAGVVGTSAAALESETKVFQLFLGLLAAEPSLASARGFVLLASSAGGVYGGTPVCPITEATPPEPISPYGRAKLLQEQLLVSWAESQPRPVATLVARLSNLYGPAQRLDKPQGLISHISRCAIHKAPVHVYVSLDTIRDYLFSEDAGRRIVSGLHRLVRESAVEALHVTKVYGSEREISIAGLLGVFRQITRRGVRVVSGLSSVGALQPRRLQFRSRIWTEDAGGQVELVEGISRVYRHQLASFGQGRLPPPHVARSGR